MKTYLVTVTRTQSIVFEIDARSPEDARHEALALSEGTWDADVPVITTTIAITDTEGNPI